MVTEDSRNREMPQPLTAPASGEAPAAFVEDPASAPDAFLETVELVGSGIYHADFSGQFLYVNPALCHLTGYSREELLGLSFQDITHPDDLTEHLGQFHRLLTGEISAYHHLEQRYRRKDGSLVWVRVNMALRSDIPGAPRAVIATAEDISAYKRLADQVHATNEQQEMDTSEGKQPEHDMRAIFEAITDLVVVFDKAGNTLHANRAARDFLGCHPTMEAGRKHLGLTHVQSPPFAPRQWVSSRVLQGETITSAQAVDMWTHTESGIETLFNVSGAPMRDTEGRIVGGVVVLRDVTTHRGLEQRTRDALDALLEMAKTLVVPPAGLSPLLLPEGDGDAFAPNPIVQRLAELAGSVLGCQRIGIVALERGSDVMHPVALTGLTPRQAAVWSARLTGRSLAEYVGADLMRSLSAGQPVLLDLNRQPLRGVAQGGPVALAVPLRLDDQLVGALALGYEQEPHSYSEEELGLAGAVGQLAALVIERDRLLQEREEAHASTLALQEANRRMDEFLGIASHELRTPLTALLGNVQLLERRLARMSFDHIGADDLADQLRMMIRLLEQMDHQGRRLSRLVSDLVDASRIDAGKLDLSLQSRDLVSIVNEIVEEQRQTHPYRIIDLALPEGAAIPVVVDADRLGQVVTNYLINALKYSQEDRPVAVTVRVDGEIARVAVRDEGPGLPLEEQSQIWELFYRAPNIEIQTGSGIGLGLGLHICKTIIERHNGQVGVTSDVGQGSTFWFALPLASHAGASPTPSA
ncbi:MAG TPA: PAS domain S-box protein [Ktedonobacterales bacterium]